MKKSNSLVKTIVRAVLLVVLLNPGMNPLLNEGAKNAATAELQKTFGMLAGGTTGAFSPARLMTALAVVILMWMLTSISCALLEKVSKGKKRSEYWMYSRGFLAKAAEKQPSRMVTKLASVVTD